MRSIKHPLIITIALTLCTAAAYSQNSASTANPFHWKGSLASGKQLTIKNINGNITAEGAPGDSVEVNATKSGDDADKVRIEVVQTSDGIGVCAIYPDSDSTCTSDGDWHTNGHNGRNNNRARVDFTVRLPRDVRLAARNVNGGVEAKDLGEVADATSVNGSVDVTTSRWAHLSSVNGSVTGHFGSADWEDKLHISTVNGNVTLALPADVSTEVEFQSVNGRLKTDLPITIQSSSGSFGPKHMRGTIGSGVRELKINTVNGSVNLEKNTM